MTKDDAIEVAYCEGRGYLTPIGWAEPSGPSDYQYAGRDPVIGCNRLECVRCRGRVTRVRDEPDGVTRVYGCGCGITESVSRPTALYKPGWEDIYGYQWTCSGHPATGG